MMDHMQTFLKKIVFNFLINFIIAGVFFEFPVLIILMIALLLSLASYFISDYIVLRKTNNVAASISDFILTFIIVFTINYYFQIVNKFILVSLLTALTIGAFSYYMVDHYRNDRFYFKYRNTNNVIYLFPHLEIAEEITPESKNNDDNKHKK